MANLARYLAGLAGIATAKDLMAVPERRKAQGFARFFLNPLHLGPLHLADSPAFDTNQMIVMRTLVLDLEFGLPVRGGHALGQAAFLQHLQGPKHRHLAD